MKRLLVANRGEIAVRIIRTAQEMGIETVLAVSEADTSSVAADLADSVTVIGPAQATKSYLNRAALIEAQCAAPCVPAASYSSMAVLGEGPESELAILYMRNNVTMVIFEGRGVTFTKFAP